MMQADVPVRPRAHGERDAILRLMRGASVEMTVHDTAHLEACRTLLGPGTPVYVSFLPKQAWAQSLATAAAVRAAGFEPIPHVPVRNLESRAALERLLQGFAAQARVRRVLLIAGDRPEPRGPYRATIEVLASGLLAPHGIEEVILAGHPEGHPVIPDAEL